MLALRLKQLQHRQSISHICKSPAEVIYEQTQINTAFREYYSKLYQSEGPINENEMEAFFQDISLPTLKEEERESLEAPVREREILAALKAFPTGKAPGNDGFTIELYKCLQNNLSPILYY